MKFTIILSITSLLAIAAAEPAPKLNKNDPEYCEVGTQICNLANYFPECSEEYVATMKACLVTGCVQFFADPLRNCK